MLMEDYIIKEFEDLNAKRKPRRTRKNDVESKRRARVIEIFEQSNGFIGPQEIADTLDIDIKKVEGYLGKIRIQLYERLKAGDNIVSDKRERKGISRVAQVSDTPVAKSEKLTPRKVNRLTNERNARIMNMNAEGLSIEEIASKEMLTLDQAKEIFLSLGLSLYTNEELSEMRKQEAEERKSREETERLERKRKKQRELVRNKRARIREEKEKQKQRREQKREQKRVEHEEVIRNYRDIKRKMRELINQRNSKGAIEFAERYIKNPEFLTEEERSELLILIKYISEIRRSYQEQHKNHENVEGHEER